MPSPEQTRVVTAGQDRSVVLLFMVTALIVLIADLVVKHYAFEHVAGVPIRLTGSNAHDPAVIPPHDAVTVIPQVLSLKLTINHGAVFGMGAGRRFFFIAVTVVAVAVIVRIFWRSGPRQRTLHFALALVLAGALGNLYDRVRLTAVRDMLYLFPDVKLPFGLTWPGGNDELYPWIFNVADAALVVGVALILLTLMRTPKTQPKAN